MGDTQDEKYFHSRNNKNRSSAFRYFIFYQNICFDCFMNLFLSKTAMSSYVNQARKTIN